VYAIVTRDVLPLLYLRREQDEAGWFNSNAYPGHKARWWGQAVCRSSQNPTAPSFPDEIEYSATYESTFLELDDGRRIPDEVFRD
jgi:hypothetical protein